MGSLKEFLEEKRKALAIRKLRLERESDIPALPLRAKVQVAGRSGVREIRIRDFQVLSDSGNDFAGYNLGPDYEHIPIYVHNIAYTLRIVSPASDKEIEALREAVERSCPISKIRLLHRIQIPCSVL